MRYVHEIRLDSSEVMRAVYLAACNAAEEDGEPSPPPLSADTPPRVEVTDSGAVITWTEIYP